MLRRILVAFALASIPTMIASAAIAGTIPPPGADPGGLWSSTTQKQGKPELIIEAQHTTAGSSSGASKSGAPKGNPGQVVYTPPIDHRTPAEKLADCDSLWDLQKRCVPVPERPADDPAPEDPRATQPITITDLASFSPAPGTLIGEPDNLGVAGLPTNFTTDAAAHTRTGTLFGYPVTARFTPASFVFHYGDGQTRTTTTAGKTWDALGLPQFTPTDTSHTYTERGTYQASVDTVYTAEIDLGTGYFPISGTLTIPGPPQDIQIYEARTALVAHTCDEDPTAEGCPTR